MMSQSKAESGANLRSSSYEIMKKFSLDFMSSRFPPKPFPLVSSSLKLWKQTVSVVTSKHSFQQLAWSPFPFHATLDRLWCDLMTFPPPTVHARWAVFPLFMTLCGIRFYGKNFLRAREYIWASRAKINFLSNFSTKERKKFIELIESRQNAIIFDAQTWLPMP